MGSASLDLRRTEAFLGNAGVPIISPSASEFEALNKTYMHTAGKPAGIAQPETAEDVSTIVKHCVAEKIPFVVRAGGHDVTNQTLVGNVLSINLRKLKHVEVSADKKTAKVGGGILSGDLLDALAPHGLEVPVGAVPTIGWLGGASLAGYTLTSPSLGLCVDQILGAKVVDAKGDIVEASEKRLKGIRGGGGNFGVVVEFTIKVHPLSEAQSGAILYQTPDPESSWKVILNKFNDLLKEDIPQHLSILPGLYAVPGMGAMCAMIIYWRGPRDDAFHHWMNRIASLGKPLMEVAPAIKTQSALQFTQGIEAMLVPRMYGQIHGCCGTALTPNVIDVLGKFAANMPPEGGSAINFHCLRKDSPSCGKPSDFPASLFGAREPHFMYECIGGSGVGEEQGAAAAKWAKDLRDALMQTDAAVSWGYAGTTREEYAVVEEVFGEKAGELRALKTEFDPDNVFRYSIPRMD